MSAAYTPRSDSLPSRVISFFTQNPDEVLDLDALEAKFGKPRSQWHTILGQAVSAGLLKRKERADDGELVYSLGTTTNTTKPGTATPTPPGVDVLASGGWLGAKTKAKPVRRKAFVPDIDKIEFIAGVPLPLARSKAGAGFAPVLLKQPVGQMFKQPHEARSALAVAMTKLKKAGKGAWEMRNFPDHLGVWRVK